MTDKTLKIALLGDGSTGKTSYFNMIKDFNNPTYKFNKKYLATSEFNLNAFLLNTSNGKINIDLWDTAGQERYGGKLRNAYIYGADGIIIFYDITNRKTLENIKFWLDTVKKICGNIPVIVLGNKLDRKNKVPNLQEVKLRDSVLKTMYGSSNIKNILFSVKENSYLHEGSWWNSSKIVSNGMFYPFEEIISKILRKTVNHLEMID